MGKPGLNSRGTHPAAKPAIGRFGPVYAFRVLARAQIFAPRRIKARRWLRLKNRGGASGYACLPTFLEDRGRDEGISRISGRAPGGTAFSSGSGLNQGRGRACLAGILGPFSMSASAGGRLRVWPLKETKKKQTKRKKTSQQKGEAG